MSTEISALLQRAVGLWRKAQVVYEGPTRLGWPEPLQAVQDIAANHPECHDELVKLLDADSQLVVAYALLTLQQMGSRFLESLPQSLLERRDNVTFSTGSFRTSMDLGGLARQVQKQARQRRLEADE